MKGSPVPSIPRFLFRLHPFSHLSFIYSSIFVYSYPFRYLLPISIPKDGTVVSFLYSFIISGYSVHLSPMLLLLSHVFHYSLSLLLPCHKNRSLILHTEVLLTSTTKFTVDIYLLFTFNFFFSSTNGIAG